jgi:hypothetical protein
MIDTCQPTRTDASDDFEPDAGSSFAVEACDGTALGGATCASLGFASGSLACTGFCDLDVSECEVCSPAAPGGSTCSALSPQAQSVAVAVNATEIAYAWVEQDSSCHGVRFDRFGLDLTRISESSCLDSCDAKSVDVAATPDGWLLAIGSSHGVDLLPLDPSGAESATPRTLPNAANPIFAQRGAGGSVAGGPLLMWGSATGGFDSFAAVLRTDGTEEQSALHTFSNVIPWAATATFIGDSFLLAYDANPTDAVPSSIVIRRLWLDGSLGAVRQPFPCRTSASNPVLTWTRSEGRLVFTDVPNTYWARLDASGSLIDVPHAVGPDPGLGLSGAAIVQDDLVIVTDGLQSGPGTPTVPWIVRVASDGTSGPPTPWPNWTPTPVGSPVPLGALTNLRPQLVVQGSAVFASALMAATTMLHADGLVGLRARGVLTQIQ